MIQKQYSSIELSKGLVALVDDEDLQLVSRFNWHLNAGYARAWEPKPGGGRRPLYMHVLIMGRPAFEVDHISRNRLDNRRSNLRVCTPSLNCANVGRTRRNSSGFKGVTFYKDRSLYSAKITSNRKTKYLGFFPDSLAAAKAYDTAAIKHFGEFALTNKQLGAY